jgi:DNA-binding MarR family transcriptional regulator
MARPAEVQVAPYAAVRDAPGSPELRLARRHLAERRLRDAAFGAELFGEPAWDILLTLFIAQADGRRLCVTRLCGEIPVPNTTALRWVFALTEKGMLTREADPRSRRRIYVSLSREARTAVRALLARCGSLRT